VVLDSRLLRTCLIHYFVHIMLFICVCRSTIQESTSLAPSELLALGRMNMMVSSWITHSRTLNDFCDPITSVFDVIDSSLVDAPASIAPSTLASQAAVFMCQRVWTSQQRLLRIRHRSELERYGVPLSTSSPAPSSLLIFHSWSLKKA
jgi:hypothetical protein